MGSGTATDVWRNQDGVRVTVVTSEGAVVSTPFDLTNYNVPSGIIHFGKVCKLQYLSGTALSPAGSYSCSKPGISLPRIISGRNSRTSIEAIKRYFCSEYTAQLVSSRTGIPFDELTSGSYKLIIEPIAYFIHGGRNYAMTATEAALYNQKSNGALRSKLPSLTHQNLPLSIFLEVPDLGIPTWSGSTSGKVSDTNIISSLGIGIISYKEREEEAIDLPDYTYRVDTDVITSIMLTTEEEINPDHPASVTFHINGTTYTVRDIVIPAGASQVVWVKWHTPQEPTSLTIEVSVTRAETAKSSFSAKVISLDENPPPDPMATDINPGYRIPALPNNPEKTSASWSVWSAAWKSIWNWESDWQWETTPCTATCLPGCPRSHGQWTDHGQWVDNGYYEFTSTVYSASLTGTTEIHPDDIVPTANGDTMKSGYGIKQNALTRFSSNAPEDHWSPAQTAVSYFPEFYYKDYWRLLERTGTTSAAFQFKQNEYSTYNRAVHFTPVYFPDSTDYNVYTYIIDAWTPSGMLSVNVNDSVHIFGSLYDDWYSKRE